MYNAQASPQERKPLLPVVFHVLSVPVLQQEYSHPWLRSPDPTLDLGLWTSNMKLETGAPTTVGHLKPRLQPSTDLSKCSSTLPNPSSNLPNRSSRAQLEPLKTQPNRTTISRQTTYEFDAEKTASDLSTYHPLPISLTGSTRRPFGRSMTLQNPFSST